MKCIGTKLIDATPMTRAEYNAYRGWTLPANEVGAEEGFLVEYLDGGKANDSRHVGYITWTPSEPFNKAYRPIKGMTFGMALEALKIGQKVARSGWNGKGMWLSLSGALSGHLVDSANFWSPHNEAFAISNGGKALVQPCITMKTAADEIQMGWLASQSDMLAQDWEIVT